VKKKKMKKKEAKAKALALAICTVFLVAMSGIVLADQSENAVDLNNNGILGDETSTVYVPSALSVETGVKESTETVIFPSSSDTYEIYHSYLWWWHVGDKVYGDRTLTLDSVNKVDMRLQITESVLWGSGHCDMFLSINGVKVGSWQVLEGDTVIERTFTFDPITGPVYSIKIEETNEVEPGKGSCQLGPDVSTLTFYGAEEKPTISISTDKFKYCPCETMLITVDISNPTDSPVIFKWFVGAPTLKFWKQVDKKELPAGYEGTIEIKLHVGEWSKTPFGIVWYVDLQDPETDQVLAADSTCCAYCTCKEAISVPTPFEDITVEIG